MKVINLITLVNNLSSGQNKYFSTDVLIPIATLARKGTTNSLKHNQIPSQYTHRHLHNILAANFKTQQMAGSLYTDGNALSTHQWPPSQRTANHLHNTSAATFTPHQQPPSEHATNHLHNTSSNYFHNTSETTFTIHQRPPSRHISRHLHNKPPTTFTTHQLRAFIRASPASRFISNSLLVSFTSPRHYGHQLSP